MRNGKITYSLKTFGIHGKKLTNKIDRTLRIAYNKDIERREKNAKFTNHRNSFHRITSNREGHFTMRNQPEIETDILTLMEWEQTTGRK